MSKARECQISRRGGMVQYNMVVSNGLIEDGEDILLREVIPGEITISKEALQVLAASGGYCQADLVAINSFIDWSFSRLLAPNNGGGE